MALGIINFQLIIFYLRKKRQCAPKRIQSKWCTFQFSFWHIHLVGMLTIQQANTQHTVKNGALILDVLQFHLSFLFLCFFSPSVDFHFDSECHQANGLYVVHSHTHMQDRNHNRKKNTNSQWTHYYFISNHLYNCYYCFVFVASCGWCRFFLAPVVCVPN